MESIHVKAKNFTNIFVEADKDENEKDVVRLSIHIIGGSARAVMSKHQAQQLIEALQSTIKELA